MQQRRLRLGDILDDYCPRERRITNHAVVAMIEDEVKQTRCTTCDADHEYKAARVPPPRRKRADAVAGEPAEGMSAPASRRGRHRTDGRRTRGRDRERRRIRDVSRRARAAPAPADNPDADADASGGRAPRRGRRPRPSPPDSRDAAASRRAAAGAQGTGLHDSPARRPWRPRVRRQQARIAVRARPAADARARAAAAADRSSDLEDRVTGPGGQRNGSGQGRPGGGNRPGQPGAPRGNRPGQGAGRGGGGGRKRGR